MINIITTIFAVIGVVAVVLSLGMLVTFKMKGVSYATHIYLIKRQYKTVDDLKGEDYGC